MTTAKKKLEASRRQTLLFVASAFDPKAFIGTPKEIAEHCCPEPVKDRQDRVCKHAQTVLDALHDLPHGSGQAVLNFTWEDRGGRPVSDAAKRVAAELRLKNLLTFMHEEAASTRKLEKMHRKHYELFCDNRDRWSRNTSRDAQWSETKSREKAEKIEGVIALITLTPNQHDDAKAPASQHLEASDEAGSSPKC